MTATLTKSLRFDPLTSTIAGDISASISIYIDPVTHIPARGVYYNLSLDGAILSSGLRSGGVTLSFSEAIGQGLHSLYFFAGNSTSTERVSWSVDIQNYSAAAQGVVLFGQDETAGSERVDYAYGSAQGDSFFMGQNDDFVFGYRGNDYIDGGAGADWMEGGRGHDVYLVDNIGDVIVEAAGEGRDTVYSMISLALAANVEDLRLDGNAAINGTGNELANLIVGNAEVNVLSGLAGNDTLDGRAGADVMQGGAGSDVYTVDNIGDLVDEGVPGSDGLDQVRSSVSFSLVNTAQAKGGIENVLLLGAANISALGNDLANTLEGNSGINNLNGGRGADILIGRGGNDVYTVDNAGDLVDESVAGSNGVDTVRSTVSFSLVNSTQARGAIENVVLLGTGNISALGNELDNTLQGNDGANNLNGGLGADIMIGGNGNDVYTVDNIGDLVDESGSGDVDGADLIRATVSIDLTDSARVRGGIETVQLVGSANIDATGDAQYNLLIGNAGNNILDGGIGGDTMRGGAGNDSYVVDSGFDSIDESLPGSGGIDTVLSYLANFDLTFFRGMHGQFENVTLMAEGLNQSAFGNGVANVLIGNGDNNQLLGRLGNDTLTGGGGDDSFVFDSTPNSLYNVDRITDMNEAGNDTIQLSHFSYEALAVGELEANAFRISSTGAGDADDRIIYNRSTGELFYDVDGNGAAAAVRFAIVDPGLALTAADFLVA